MATKTGSTKIEYYNPDGRADIVYLRHKSDNQWMETWIHYYDVDGYGGYCIPRLPITFNSADRNYWYMFYERNGIKRQIANNFYCSFSSSDSTENRCGINAPASNFWMKFSRPDGSDGSSGCNKSIY